MKYVLIGLILSFVSVAHHSASADEVELGEIEISYTEVDLLKKFDGEIRVLEDSSAAVEADISAKIFADSQIILADRDASY